MDILVGCIKCGEIKVDCGLLIQQGKLKRICKACMGKEHVQDMQRWTPFSELLASYIRLLSKDHLPFEEGDNS